MVQITRIQPLGPLGTQDSCGSIPELLPPGSPEAKRSTGNDDDGEMTSCWPCWFFNLEAENPMKPCLSLEVLGPVRVICPSESPSGGKILEDSLRTRK